MSHTPNHVPGENRLLYVVLSVLFIVYGTLGFLVDDIYLPGRRGPGTHFHGLACGLLYAGLLCISGGFLATVVDH